MPKKSKEEAVTEDENQSQPEAETPVTAAVEATANVGGAESATPEVAVLAQAAPVAAQPAAVTVDVPTSNAATPATPVVAVTAPVEQPVPAAASSPAPAVPAPAAVVAPPANVPAAPAVAQPILTLEPAQPAVATVVQPSAAPAPAVAPPTLPQPSAPLSPIDILGMSAPTTNVLDPLAALGLPSMMETSLADAQQQAIVDDNLSDAESRLSLAYAAFPQGKGEKYLENTKYLIYIGKKDSNPQEEKNYNKRVKMLYIDSVLIRPQGGKGKPLGGRLMWPTKPNGERDLEKGLVCQSLDGITPMPRFIGQDVFDYRTGTAFTIGYRRDLTTGQKMPMDNVNICAQCPASQWMDINGKKAQLCKSNWSWVVYDVVNDRMVKVSGGNAGTQMALEGRAKGQMGAQKDGAALVGIEHFFKETGKRQIVVNVVDGKLNLSPLQLTCVAGVTTSDGVDAPVTPVTAMLPTGERNEAFYNILQTGLVKAVILSIPTYPYAPQGRPEYVGNFEVPVYPVEMVAVPNNFLLGGKANPTSVPNFELGTEPLTPEQYAGYLRQRKDYYDQGMRNALLGLEMHEKVMEILKANAPLQISNPAMMPQPVLPSVAVSAAAEGDVVEGIFTVPTDVPTDE